MKYLLADQDTLMECDKMKFIFQERPLCRPHIGVAVLGSHWSKKPSTDMTFLYELFSPLSANFIDSRYEWYLWDESNIDKKNWNFHNETKYPISKHKKFGDNSIKYSWIISW